MIDDDTYLLLDNLHQFLSLYDHTKYYYFGNGHHFSGCGQKVITESPVFAQGGSGIVLSRGAVQKLMGSVDYCIEKYKDCWAGDIRLALCLNDIGISLNSVHTFNSKPPNDDFHFTSPCLKPVSFHHLLLHQTQKLYSLEKSLEKNGVSTVTLGDIASSFLEDGLAKGVDRPGSDYTHFAEPLYDRCHEACKNDYRCVAFIHDSRANCWLKDSIPSVKTTAKSVSGIVLDHYKCTRSFFF